MVIFLILFIGYLSFLGVQNMLIRPNFHCLESAVFAQNILYQNLPPNSILSFFFFLPVIHNKSSIWRIFRRVPTWVRSRNRWEQTLMEKFLSISKMQQHWTNNNKKAVCELTLLSGEFHLKSDEKVPVMLKHPKLALHFKNQPPDISLLKLSFVF